MPFRVTLSSEPMGGLIRQVISLARFWNANCETHPFAVATLISRIRRLISLVPAGKRERGLAPFTVTSGDSATFLRSEGPPSPGSSRLALHRLTGI